jgi:hypothetical protein
MIAGVLLTSCADISKLFPKKSRMFEEKSFNSAEWKAGDYQTRGEMARNLYQSRWDKTSPNNLDGKSSAEVLQLLGEPDKKTRGNCCHARHAPEGEVWLYKIQTLEGPEGQLEERAVQIFLTEDGKNVKDFTFGEMEDKPVYIPAIG